VHADYTDYQGKLSLEKETKNKENIKLKSLAEMGLNTKVSLALMKKRWRYGVH